MMLTPPAQRAQQFAAMSDEELANLGKQISDANSQRAQLHRAAHSAYAASAALEANMLSLISQQGKAREELSSTPWYRPFKKASIRRDIAARSGQIETAKSAVIANSSVISRARVAGAGIPGSLESINSTNVARDISQVLHARADERQRLDSLDLRRRKQAQLEIKAEQQRRRKAAPGKGPTMKIFYAMADDMDAYNAEKEREAQIERERPRYGYYPA